MSEFTCRVVKLGPVSKVPDSDFLEFVTIMDEYPVVFRSGSFKENDLACFFSYDSVLPDNETFYFLAPPERLRPDGTVKEPKPTIGNVPEKYRTIKSKSIRGFYSEGIIIPCPPDLKEGDDIVDYFGVTKRVYDEELPDLPGKGSNENEVSPNFSLFKYDLAALADVSHSFQEGEQILIFEKLEGEATSWTYHEGQLWVRSRNFWKRKSETSHWWEVPLRMNIEEKLSQFPDIALKLELYGAVRGFSYDCPVIDRKLQRKARVYDAYDIRAKKFLEWDKVVEMCNVLELETVPLLYTGPWKTDRSLHPLAEGLSTFGKNVREGFVMRSVPEQVTARGARKICKLKGRDYKLFKK